MNYERNLICVTLFQRRRAWPHALSERRIPQPCPRR